MTLTGFKHHPYIPNSVPEIQKEMLADIGLTDLSQLHREIPDNLKLSRPLDLPEPLASECELKTHVLKILKKNRTCQEYINFLGAGCWQHYVPAVCDEINSRGEFLTAYGGEPYNDHGRFQALFEYQSLMAELVDMEVVNVPTMDWAQAAATAIRMAARITGRRHALVPSLMDPEKRAIINNYCSPDIRIESFDCHADTGLTDLQDLYGKIGPDTAAVYFENPCFAGHIETQGDVLSARAHDAGALSVVGVDPISLGVLAPPPSYGADIVCGDLQPLGIHMNYGGGQSGFIATRDEEKYVMEYPSRLFGIAPTTMEGEYGFGDVAFDRTSFGHHREQGKEYVGTQTALWGITAGVYLSLMGPAGMAEVGQTIVQNTAWAMERISSIKGVSAPRFNATPFKEFVVDFNATGRSVAQINEALLAYRIFGGKDLSSDFAFLGQCALFCVTEIHTPDHIDRLVDALSSILA